MVSLVRLHTVCTPHVHRGLSTEKVGGNLSGTSEGEKLSQHRLRSESL